jgi:hypothetical protein
MKTAGYVRYESKNGEVSSQVFPFSKYRGFTVKEVAEKEPEFLRWIYDKVKNSDLREAIRIELEKLGEPSTLQEQKSFQPDKPPPLPRKLKREKLKEHFDSVRAAFMGMSLDEYRQTEDYAHRTKEWGLQQ